MPSSSPSTADSGSGRRLRGAAEWWLVLRIGALRVALPLLKRGLPASRLVRLLAAPRTVIRNPVRERLVLAVAGRMWRRWPGTCFERSLAVHRELGKAGASPKLVLAMGRHADEMVGHAWVEVDGRPVLEASDPRESFAAVVAFDANGNRLPDQR